MPSLIPGYEYDIFISYRQKDNKYDGWVTEFVDNLRKELEATFKDEISVYFDINPHDGLLETHDVDASLAGKLRCLIFIPILSRTYCDPKSFAWQHEFRAFVEQASHDKFGLKVKLPTGNVANRVLPIRIHDLDIEDIKLCESVIGSVLRGIEFIYKEPGVNRPLRSTEDSPGDNIGKTYYRNQVNKVALAIKEIILGLKGEAVIDVVGSSQIEKPHQKNDNEEKQPEKGRSSKFNKRKILATVSVATILIITTILVFPKILRTIPQGKLRSTHERISVAVMPFQNMTNDTIWNVWQNGIQDMLINFLSNFTEDLKIKQIESINNLIKSKGLTNYASITPSFARTVSKKLDADVFIFGGIKEAGSKTRLSAQLIDSYTEEIIRSFEIEMVSKEEAIFPIIDSLKIAIRNFLVISQKANEVSPEILEIATTGSPEAYGYFIYGLNAFNSSDYPTAANWLFQAVEIDSNFTYARILLSESLLKDGKIGEAKSNCLKIYLNKDQMPVLLKTYTNYLHALLFETPLEEIKYLRQILDINDQSPTAYYHISQAYYRLQQFDVTIPFLEKALEIYNIWDLRPLFEYYSILGDSYHKTGHYKKEKQLYKKAEQYYIPDLFNRRYSILYLTEGDTARAKQYIEKIVSVGKRNHLSDADLAFNLALIYSDAGNLKQAEEYYRKSFALEPDNSISSAFFAKFLIENNLNVEEGIKLIDKFLVISPGNFSYLDTKGWGLYKQCKYQEALEILQKSWDLRTENSVYNHEAFLHLEAAKKAVEQQK